MALLVSYCDADVYPRDLGLFEEKKWLNDHCINYCFRRIEMGDQHWLNLILMVDPALISFLKLQCDDDEERAELAAGLGIDSKRWILAPVNDCDSFSAASSHWSLLLCNISTGLMVHFDSNGQYNRNAGRETASLVSQLIGKPASAPVRFIQAAVPQQTNGYDCGMYTVMFADRLRAMIIADDGGLAVELQSCSKDGPVATELRTISPKAIRDRREYWKSDILGLAKDYRNGGT
jgi:hypothetical protein